MQKALKNHAPWRIVHVAIAGLFTLKAIIVGTLLLTLGIAVD
jgi:hypothetical protein